MLCTDKPWQYGIKSPRPSEVGKKIYGVFIIVRTPPKLPEDLNCLFVIWPALYSKNWFYQTSLGYHPKWGWHVSAGSTNPQLPCNLHCEPFKVGGVQFKPKPNTVYELGIRFIPQNNGKNKVYLYFVDWSTATLYNIFVLEDTEIDLTQPVYGVIEAYTADEHELLKLGGDNAFKIEAANWLIEPWISETWPHAYGYDPPSNENYYRLPEAIRRNIQIRLISPGKLYIGYKVGGKHYNDGEKIW